MLQRWGEGFVVFLFFLCSTSMELGFQGQIQEFQRGEGGSSRNLKGEN